MRQHRLPLPIHAPHGAAVHLDTHPGECDDLDLDLDDPLAR